MGPREALSQEGSGQYLKAAEPWEARGRGESGEIQDFGLWVAVLPTELENLGGEGALEG